jgi:hypothetical protein
MSDSFPLLILRKEKRVKEQEQLLQTTAAKIEGSVSAQAVQTQV